MRFLGNTEARLDPKGRVFLPAAFRKSLAGAELIVRKDVFQDCLVIYPEEVWNEQMDALRRRLNRWNKAHQQVFRQYVSEAEAVSLDASGRILLPRRLTEMVGIARDVRFIGMGDTIEIWPSAGAEKPFMDAGDFGKALEELMGQEEGVTNTEEEKTEQ